MTFNGTVEVVGGVVSAGSLLKKSLRFGVIFMDSFPSCFLAFSFDGVVAAVLVYCCYSKRTIVFKGYAFLHTLGDLGVTA